MEGLMMPLGMLNAGNAPYYYPFMFFLTYICNIAFYSYFWMT